MKICKNYADCLCLQVGSGSGTIITNPSVSDLAEKFRIRILILTLIVSSVAELELREPRS
jgi:hypothetical protein